MRSSIAVNFNMDAFDTMRGCNVLVSWTAVLCEVDQDFDPIVGQELDGLVRRPAHTCQLMLYKPGEVPGLNFTRH